MDSVVKKYRYWEWRTILVLFVGYALFYFVRKNLGMAIPAMEAELGISKMQLGIFLTLHSIIYGFSRFVNGMLVDRFSKRKVMSLGLLLTCAVNLSSVSARSSMVCWICLMPMERQPWVWCISSVRSGCLTAIFKEWACLHVSVFLRIG